MNKNEKIINLIAVRLKSKRLPGKALLDICGKPLLWHLVDRVRRAKIPYQTVICTSTLPGDDPIQEFAERNNFSFFRGHPDDVLIRFIEAAVKFEADHVVRITGDNPLTDPEIIDSMVALHIEQNAEYTFTEDPPRGTRPEIISLSSLKKCHRLSEDPNNSEYMTLYFKNYPFIFKNIKYVCPDTMRCRPNYILTVDTSADFEVVNQIYVELLKRKHYFSLDDVIAFLDSNPEIPHSSRNKEYLDLSHINTKISTEIF